MRTLVGVCIVPTVITVGESAIDWVTATAASVEAASSLACLAERIVCDAMAEGHERGPWSQYGYVGECIEGLSWGRRKDGTILRVSGFTAAYFGWDVLERAENVSRLDIQCTIRTDPPLKGVAIRADEELLAAGERGRRGAECSFFRNSRGGSTSYLGRRSSDKFLRIYDKWVESQSEHYAGCWRYELEVKNEPALLLGRHLLACPNRASAIRDTVYKYCVSHSLTPIFNPGTDGLQLAALRPPTDYSRTCKWLNEQVRISAQKVVYEEGIPALLRLLELDQTERNWRTKGPTRPHGNHDDHDDGNLK